MSVRTESLHRLLRPARSVAVGVMLAPICLGTLVVTSALLLHRSLASFDVMLMLASGTTLVGLGVRDAERDRAFSSPAGMPSIRMRAFVWGAVILFASGPLVFMALMVDRFAGTSVVTMLALAASSGGWTLTSYRKLRFDAVWLPRPKDEEVEGGLALGALLLTAVLFAAWALVEIDGAFGGGPLPTGLSSEGGMLLSISASILAGMACLVPIAMRRAAVAHSPTTVHVALSVLLVPLCVLLLFPAHRWGEPLPSFVPFYAAKLAGRVFLSAVLSFGVVELMRVRRAT